MMSERFQHPSDVRYSYTSTARMENDFSPKKTMVILVIVVGCFAVLWPSVFYPMLVGSANQHIKPSAIDRTTGCCYVLSEKDVDTIEIMSELCGNIIKNQMGEASLTAKQITNICQNEVLKTCGIDISAVLQEQVRLGKTTKDILDQVRSLNGSLCLKYNFGVAPWRLGVPHIITLRNTSDMGVPQERPPHLRSEMVHPALLERGSAIPQKDSRARSPKIIIDGKPPIPGSRPPMGAGAHGIRKPEPRTMGIIMPIYTVGIIIFFTYTIMKVVFKKHPDTDNIIYSTVERQDPYRKDTIRESSSRGSGGSCTLGWKERDAIVNAMSALLDEVDQDMEGRRQSRECTVQDDSSSTSNMSNGSIKKDEKPSVKVMAMETSESCEGGKKWQSINSSVLPNIISIVNDQVSPPQEIFLDRALPPQSQILVAASATETENNSGDDPAVVLAGKMTLSVISLENENLEIQETKNAKKNEINNKEIFAISKQMLKTEIDCLIEEAVGNLEISKLDVIDAKDTKVEAADIETVADTIETNKQITEKVNNISKLLEEKDYNTVQFETSIEDEKLKHEINTEILAENRSGTTEEQGEISNPEQLNDISPIVGIDIIKKKDITNLSDSENLLIEYSRKDENSKENENVVSSSETFSHDSSNEHKSSIVSNIKRVDDTKEYPTEVDESGILSTLLSSKTHHLNETEEKVTKDSQNMYNESSIEASKSVKILCDESANKGSNISLTPLLNAKSSSEESGSSVHTASNPGSVVNVSTKYETKTEEELNVSEDEELDISEDEESDVESEEIEISDEEIEVNRNSSELNERFNTNGNTLLINGNDQNHEKEESDEDEEVEEIIEEYSEEEEEVEDDEDINDTTHLSNNGN